MTRKKSNVKALALAVTCAILAGGGMGLEPVYAAPEPGIIPTTGDVTYDRISTELKYGDATSSTDIRELTVGGVTIGGTGGISGKIIAKNIVGIKNTGESTPSDISINGATFANGGAITATSLKLNGMDDVKTAIEAKAAKTDVDNNKANISDLQTSKADAANVYTKIESDSRFAGKTYEGKVDVLEATVNDTSTGLVKKVGDLETKTTDISYDSTTGTTIGRVDGVTFNAGAVSGVKSINGKIEISADGKTVTFNRGETNGQVEISAAGIKVGTGSTYIKGDAIYTGDANYDNAKAGMKSDGSLKAANGNFTVEGATGNTTVGGTLSVAGETTFANGIKTDTIVEKTANAGVTVNGNKITTDNKFNDVELKNGNVNATDITANGALKGKTLGIGTNGTEFTVNADGEVQAAGGKVSIDKTGKATFGYTAGNITTIEGEKITTGSIVATDTTVASNISGVQMLDGKITASNMEITGAISLNDLTVNNKLTVGAFSVDKNGVVAGVQSINGANVTASGTGLTIGSATVGAANPFSSTGFTVDANGNVAAQNITAGTYNGNTIGADNKFNGVELKGGDVKATKVTADTITDGTAIMTGGTVTANTITANTSASLAGVTFDASGVDFNGKDIKNVANVTATNVTATTAKLGNLSIAGHVIKNEVDAGGPIGLGTTVTVNNAGELGGITKIDGVNVTDDAGGLAIGTGATQVTIGGANAISVGAGTFTVDSAGLVTGNQFTTTNGSYLKDNELKLNDANIWNTTEGLKAEKAVIGANTLDTAGISTTGTLGVEGVATFGKDAADQTKITQGKAEFTQGGKTTTIKGGEIETDKLTVNDIVLKNSMKDGAGNTITIKGSDGSMSVAGGKFAVDDKGQMTNEIQWY